MKTRWGGGKGKDEEKEEKEEKEEEKMSPWRDKQTNKRTRKDRATQPMDGGKSKIFDIYGDTGDFPADQMILEV